MTFRPLCRQFDKIGQNQNPKCREWEPRMGTVRLTSRLNLDRSNQFKPNINRQWRKYLEEQKADAKLKGFAAMSADQRKLIASRGGKAVSSNPTHMANIGRRGGLKVSENRDHMAAIGRKGGRTTADNIEKDS